MFNIWRAYCDGYSFTDAYLVDGFIRVFLAAARRRAVGLERVGAAQLGVDLLALLGLRLPASLQLVLGVLHRSLPAGHVLCQTRLNVSNWTNGSSVFDNRLQF